MILPGISIPPKKSTRWLLAALIPVLLAACGIQAVPHSTPIPQPLAGEITFYDWEEDMPQSVLDAFTEEYGVKVNYLVYESQEEAIENMKEGKVYDVVVMESRFIPLLVKENLLAEFDQRNLPNTKNLFANFRELAYDPGNRYSIPYNWGTTGLVVRSDLVAEPVTRWADLWEPRYYGRIGLWMGQRREVISLTLKSLGYSANSENPAELESALERLLEVKPHILVLEDFSLVNSADILANGQALITMGYASDYLYGHEQNPAITYVLPAEGALLWNDTFIIPSNSPNKSTAELFLNFLMRAEVNARIVNENLYASPNEAAYPFVEVDILNNPVIFPPNKDLANAELVLPLSPQGQQLYDEIWERLINAR
ncbi:MAG: spermidine/putrescine ABC transporter substrate-binding protein [Chloroflexi bacterium]|nr:spermidine/putrescine ABC transporter substrate-binding protein [Chloroflexota bacterium]